MVSFVLFVFMALDSFPVDAAYPSLVVPDSDRFDDAREFRARQIDRQQAVLQVRSLHFNAVSQHKGPLELTCRDAAVKVFPGLVILLPAADHQLVFLGRHVELDRKSTRLNSSHLVISYAVFCLKKKKEVQRSTLL